VERAHIKAKTQDVMVKNNELQIYVILFLLWVKKLKINVIKITIKVCHQNNSKIYQQSKVPKEIFSLGGCCDIICSK
jgi:hypothetical protein